jgi:uncharacterized membrane protein YphA (DoxX/SURF4 family)
MDGREAMSPMNAALSDLSVLAGRLLLSAIFLHEAWFKIATRAW